MGQWEAAQAHEWYQDRSAQGSAHPWSQHLIVDNSIPSGGLEEQNRGKMWADERDVWDQLILETPENFGEGSLPQWSSQDHLWEHLVLLEKILEQDLVQVLLLGFPLPIDAPCDLPQAGQSWQKDWLVFPGTWSACILPHLPGMTQLVLEVFSSQDHSDLLQTLKFPVKDLPQVLEPQ